MQTKTASGHSPSIAQRLAAAVAPPPQSDPLPHEIEMKRRIDLLKRVRVLKDKARNRLEVQGGDSSKIYVWVHNSEVRRQYFESLDYKVCRDPNVNTRWKREDGTHTCGDLILFEIDKELHEASELESLYRAMEAIEGSQSEFLAFAERNRIPVPEHK